VWSFVYIIPLIAFLFSPRFLNGLKKRVNLHENLNVTEAGKFKIKRLFIMPKVMAYYIYTSIIPRYLGFFTNWGIYAHNIARDRIYYLTLILNICFFIWGYQIDPQMIIWWYGYMLVFSQYAVFGMFTAERYSYFGNVAFCVLLAKFLQPYEYIYTIVCTIYFCRTWLYIKVYKSNRALFQASIEAFPDTPENYNNLGTEWLRKRMFHRALECFMLAYRLSKWRSGNLLHNLALASYKTANYQKGLYYIQEGLSQDKFPKDRMDQIYKIRNDCLNGIEYLNRKRKGLVK
jgi:tetratricopeptide (TPR) repeat protein